ncbi:MAG: transcription elongation factor GreAB [Rhodospirillales bacterium]|jgi:transcription elongation factor GreB|nr:transcription elongation factor GreAB [Rhodospirillales bacterium]MBT4041203.1 transcription elongation factor GreAB [Rhodospirillales bacterium]MBT4625126.1 transcription elongation factor GreAB [Rhodospirillales bacterium]MBT5353330.1 transcription elongation factor GreAB [Rhodospirillales bacterium]MBT5520155.1 transcription elongation factor GreAB [Rhodospirillales bacterium]
MSRAFVKEPDGDAVGDDTPELPISPHANHVTQRGYLLLTDELSALAAQRQALIDHDDPMKTQLERFAIERRQRYVITRLESAIVATCDGASPDTVEFGCRVHVVDDDDTEANYIIVGEDEADPGAGLISWTSPIARILMRCEVGDTPLWRRPKGDTNLEILSIGWPKGG